MFIANASAYYLFPPSNDDENTVNEWLEWEATVLAPNIAVNLGTSTKSQSKVILTNCLRILNDALSSKQSISGVC